MQIPSYVFVGNTIESILFRRKLEKGLSGVLGRAPATSDKQRTMNTGKL